MPTPKTESLATFGQCVGGGQPSDLARFGRRGALFEVLLRHGHRNVRPVLAADALHDHIDDNARLGQLVEDLGGQSRRVGQADERDPRLRLVEVDVAR